MKREHNTEKINIIPVNCLVKNSGAYITTDIPIDNMQYAVTGCKIYEASGKNLIITSDVADYANWAVWHQTDGNTRCLYSAEWVSSDRELSLKKFCYGDYTVIMRVGWLSLFNSGIDFTKRTGSYDYERCEYGTFNHSGNITIFSNFMDQDPVGFYGVDMYESDMSTLKHSLRPVKVNGVYGVWDSVTEKFYPGTGSFYEE